MIIGKQPSTHISYLSFLKELELLLHHSGILLSRPSIINEYSQKENQAKSVSDDEPLLGRIDFYIDEHLSEPLTLEELAGQIQLDKYQLIRRFRNETNTTPWQYLITKRIDKACELLEGGMSSSQVAQETGFYDQSHLNRVFKKEMGITPKKYQEENFINKN